MTSRNNDPLVRRALRVLTMVHELHKLGYQKIRIAPGLSGSGAYWRCAITHVGNILKAHGAQLRDWDCEAARYTTGQSNAYFDWPNAHNDTARQLAAKFLDRFAVIAAAGKGSDWAYAGWYVQMLGVAEAGDLPIAYADWYGTPDPRWLPTTKAFDSGLPMPPGGEAEPKSDSDA